MSKPRISDKIVTVVGGIFLIALVASAWFPQPCSLLRRGLIGCPVVRMPEMTAEEKEDAGVAHQDVLSTYAFFTVQSQDFREVTQAVFKFKGELDKRIAVLQVKKAGGFQSLGLVTHPALVNLAWPSISANGLRLYQKDATFSSIDEFLARRPAASQIAADTGAARQAALPEKSYAVLENQNDLGTASYVLTTYDPPQKEGSWYEYNHTFNVQDAAVTEKNELEWAVYFPQLAAGEKPFQLGTVHINFTRMRP